MCTASAYFFTHVPAYPSSSLPFNNPGLPQEEHLSGSAGFRLAPPLDVNSPASHLLSVGHRQPGGWCLLRADYPGRRVLLSACWLGECSLCALIIRRDFLQRGEAGTSVGTNKVQFLVFLDGADHLIFWWTCWLLSCSGEQCYLFVPYRLTFHCNLSMHWWRCVFLMIQHSVKSDSSMVEVIFSF